jgi:hypothetical protein
MLGLGPCCTSEPFPAESRREIHDLLLQGSNDFMGFATVKLSELRVSDLTSEKAFELKAKGKEKVSGSIFIGYSYETADYKSKNQLLRAEREKEEAALLSEHTKSASERTDFIHYN